MSCLFDYVATGVATWRWWNSYLLTIKPILGVLRVMMGGLLFILLVRKFIHRRPNFSPWRNLEMMGIVHVQCHVHIYRGFYPLLNWSHIDSLAWAELINNNYNIPFNSFNHTNSASIYRSRSRDTGSCHCHHINGSYNQEHKKEKERTSIIYQKIKQIVHISLTC